MNRWKSFVDTLGPGLLGGLVFRDWLRLLRDQNFAVHPRYFVRALAITALSLKNSAFLRKEQRRFDAEIQSTKLEPPIFVLGHWRSGTTHLHQLLAQDSRFAYPNNCETLFPHTFLTTFESDARMFARLLPKNRPIDQMEWSATSPQEDEMALCLTTLKSPYLGAIFPQTPEQFLKFLAFRDVPPAHLDQWRSGFVYFLKKLQLRYPGRPLILKSPTHTARIRLLLEIFPGAKFVHIHRNPYTVFQSHRRALARFCALQTLQKPDPAIIEDWVIRQHNEMYDAFFADLPLIPRGRFHEIAFEDLDRDPLAELRKLYSVLDLPDFAIAEPALRNYIASLSGYQKSAYADLSPTLKSRIAASWKRSFTQWGYPE